MVWSSLGGSPDPISITAVLKNFSPAGIAAFNASFPAGMPTTSCGQGQAVTQTSAGPIRHYSWSGDAPFTKVYDPSDPALVALSLFYEKHNDGLGDSCATHFDTDTGPQYTTNNKRNKVG